MAGSVVVDAGFLVALLNRRDRHHQWAVSQAPQFPRPWLTCEASLSEAFHLVGASGATALSALVRRRVLLVGFQLGGDEEAILNLMAKYADVPMSLADACLVRMTEARADVVLLTTDADFRIYRRHSRQVVPSHTPP